MVRPAFEDYVWTAAELRQPSHLWYAGLMRTSVLLLDGRLDEAEAQAEQTYAEGLRAQSWDAGAAHLLALSALRREQGRLAELEEDLIDAGSLYPGYRLFRCVLALVCLESGRGEDARVLAREIVHGGEETLPHDNGWAYGMSTLSEIVARTGDTDLATILYDEMLPYAHLMATGGGEIGGGSLERSLGQVASVLGRTDEALSHLDVARSGAPRGTAPTSGSPAPMWTTRSVRLKRGTDDDRRIAAQLLQAAGEVSRRRGWVGIAARVDELTGGTRPRRRARRAHSSRGRGGASSSRGARRTARWPSSSCSPSEPSSPTCSTSSRSWASPPVRRSPRGWYGAVSAMTAKKISSAAP